MLALLELTEDVQTYIEEVPLEEGSLAKQKRYMIEGIFMQSDIKNKNQRIYPYNIMKEAVDFYSKDFISTGRAMGELGHPKNPEEYVSINLDRVSHKIVGLKEDGKNFVGKAQILNTPYGNIVQNLMEGGIKFGISSRALGSIKEENGAKVVQKGFRLITPADIVADPSAPDAWAAHLMEGTEWVYENGKFLPYEKEIKKMIDEKKLVEAFTKFLELIK